MDTETAMKTSKNTCESPPNNDKIKPITIAVKSYVLTTKTALKLLLNGKLKTKVCRYCLRITTALSELDQIMQIANKSALYKVTIRDIVASSHPFKVTNDPNLPNKICEKCLNKAIQSYLFAQQCERSERALRNCFEDMYEKLEKLDPLQPTKKRGRQKLNPNYNILYTENRNVVDYAEPLYNLINVSAVAMTKESPMSILECKKCWQVLPNIESLANHENIHPKSMWFSCRICGKSFAKKYNMNRHVRMHEKGKVLEVLEKESNFECKQCGHFTDNHNLHLQHIEMHKFKMVLEHLVERKMDKLCSVCLNNDSKMIGMDKIICLHGGYPELTGDRSLYNIIGSTVPELNYKYQELNVPQMAAIMKITKKNNKVSKAINIPNHNFVFSNPEILSNETIKFEEISLFIFSAPEKVYDKINITDIGTYDVEGNLGNNVNERSIEFDNEVVKKNHEKNHSSDNFSKPDLDEYNKTGFSFSKPFYLNKHVIIDSYSHREKNTEDNDDSNNSSCARCWIFKKRFCECTKKNSQRNINNSTEPCKYCWIFKNTAKCEFCKMSANKKKYHVQSTDTNENYADNISMSSGGSKFKALTRINSERISAEKQNEWECKICLTTNSINRDTCLCCQSEKAYKDSPKLDLSYNFPALSNIILLKPVDKSDSNQFNMIVEDARTHEDHQEDGHLAERQGENMESMEFSNSLPGISETKSCCVNPNIHETMEIEEENEYANIVDNQVYDNTQVSNTVTVTNNSTFTHNFSLNPNTVIGNIGQEYLNIFTPRKDLQFNIGVTIENEKLSRNKNFNKTLKKLKMSILHNHTGTKICEKCLDHAITSYIFINKTHYIRNRLNVCVTNMIEALKNAQPSSKIFIEVAENGVMPISDTFDENLLLDDDQIDETKLKIDVLEDEYREKSEEDSSSDEKHKKEINVKDKIKKYTKTSKNNTNKLVNGYKVASDIGEFLTFKEKEVTSKKNPKSRFTCPICNKQFISGYFLKRHALKHVNCKTDCKDCKIKFKNKFHLREHIKMAHLLKLQDFNTCETCGKGFKSENKMALHEKCHKLRQCDLCYKIFVNQKYHDNHMQRHALKLNMRKERKIQNCSFCEKEFLSDNELSVHVNKTHLQIKPYCCDMCDKKFYTDKNLSKHKKVHSMFSIQKCEFCSKLFKCRRNLVVHIRKHIGIKPFNCSICKETFFSDHKLKHHMNKWHGGSLFCKLCKKVFVNKRGLKDHVNGAHSIF